MSERDDRFWLRRAIVRDAVERRRVTLACNEEADLYIDLRRVTLSGDSAPLVGRLLLDLVDDLEFDAVGGLTVGADPVAMALLHAAAASCRVLDVFVVRKEPKTHGPACRVEGPGIKGKRVLVVDDVVTSGGSVMEAVVAARNAGAEVVAVASVVRRGMAHKIEDGLEYRSLFTLHDLGLDAEAVARETWTWEDVQVVSTNSDDQVRLQCPGPECYRWYVIPEEHYPSLGLLRAVAEAHIKQAHGG